MKDLALFSIASQRTQWLGARSAALANNIANADTPGYKARDVAPFEAALASAAVVPVRTNAAHQAPEGAGSRNWDLVPRPAVTAKHSGNTVSAEVELMQLGDVRSQHSLVTGIVSSFHRMLLSSAKG
jgi:flagellar basal-body rod protein FlgB